MAELQAIEMAVRLHTIYKRLAPEYGRTAEAGWEGLTVAEQELAVAVCTELIAELTAPPVETAADDDGTDFVEVDHCWSHLPADKPIGGRFTCTCGLSWKVRRGQWELTT